MKKKRTTNIHLCLSVEKKVREEQLYGVRWATQKPEIIAVAFHDERTAFHKSQRKEAKKWN